MVLAVVLLAALLVATAALAVRALTDDRRRAAPVAAGLLRAGSAEGAGSVGAAFDRAAGRTAWTRMPGGF